MGMGNATGNGYWWSENFCVLPWYWRIWEYWEVKCIWWPVITPCAMPFFFGSINFSISCNLSETTFAGFLLWQQSWVLCLFITCLKRLVTVLMMLPFIHWCSGIETSALCGLIELFFFLLYVQIYCLISYSSKWSSSFQIKMAQKT